MKLLKLSVYICTYNSIVPNTAKRIKCFWGQGVTLPSFCKRVFFIDSPYPRALLPALPLASGCFLPMCFRLCNAPCGNTAERLALFVLQSYILTAPTGPAAKSEFLNMTADNVNLLTRTKWLGTSGKVLDSWDIK